MLKRSGLLPENPHKSLNIFIIYLALPAVSFKYLPYINWSKELLLPAISPVVVWFGAMIIVSIYARINRLDKETRGALFLVAGLSNTLFVGFPLIMAYFGEQEISIAIILDQLTFIVFSTLGLVATVQAKGNAVTPSVIAKKLLRFPPFLGCISALTIPHFVDISPLSPLFEKLAATVAPLALFSIGLQLKFDGWKSELKHLFFALSYKLLLAPLLILLLAYVLQIKGRVAQISIFEMAMPTLLSSSVIAEEYDVNPKLVNLITGIGILLSLITTAFWYWMIR